MKAATVRELKTELGFLSEKELVAICLRLAKHKKDSKELLSYLLYESRDEANYVREINAETTAEFAEMNTSTSYYAKKSVQRIVRKLNKYIRYSGKPETKVEVLLHFCEELLASKIRLTQSRVLVNIFVRQVAAIDKSIATLHEDLQFDFQDRREELNDDLKRLYRYS